MILFGGLADGAIIDIYTLTNKSGIEARVMTYGATLVSLRLPDRSGACLEGTCTSGTCPPS